MVPGIFVVGGFRVLVSGGHCVDRGAVVGEDSVAPPRHAEHGGMTSCVDPEGLPSHKRRRALEAPRPNPLMQQSPSEAAPLTAEVGG